LKPNLAGSASVARSPVASVGQPGLHLFAISCFLFTWRSTSCCDFHAPVKSARFSHFHRHKQKLFIADRPNMRGELSAAAEFFVLIGAAEVSRF